MPSLILDKGRLSLPSDTEALTLHLTASTADGEWHELPLNADGADCYSFDKNGVRGHLAWTTATEERSDYELKFTADEPVRLRLEFSWSGEPQGYHLIPACMFGDNNHELVRPNEFPTLHEPVEGNQAAAPLWEFRADRAACPVSMLCTESGVVGLSIDPYSDDASAEDGFIRNGLYSALLNAGGVSLGYGNDPLTYVNKIMFREPTAHRSLGAKANGSLYWMSGADRSGAHRIVRELYRCMREKPQHQKSIEEAARALAEGFAHVNWSEEFGNYTNMACRVPTDNVLKSWRPVSEIGWSGGGVFAYPLLMASARSAQAYVLARACWHC